jgi:hypothetical protein
MRAFVLEGEPLTVKIDFKGNHFPKIGDPVFAAIPAAICHLLDAKTGDRID